MVGQDAAGIERLRATIALGDSPYLEEAHFNLAKALLRRKDFGAAEAQLKALIQLRDRRVPRPGGCSLRFRNSRSRPIDELARQGQKARK